MSSYNRVILIGNLTADPEVRYSQDGSAIAGFNLAINERWKSKDGQDQERTDFIGVSAFGKQAELVQRFFSKGKPIMLEGKLRQETWEDKDTGKKRSKTTVRMERLMFLPRNEGGGVNNTQAAPSSSGIDHGARNQSGQTSGGEPFGSGDDDVPF